MIVNPATGFTREATTNEAGGYTFPSLAPGSYTLTVRRDGFAPVEIKDVVLNVNDQRSFQIQLRVGQISGDTVDVNSGNASLVNESPAVGTVVDRQFVSNLPLNGRSFQSLITLTPGVVSTRAGSANTGQFSVNGQRNNANYFTVDGVSANVGVAQFDVIGIQAGGSVPALSSTGGTNNLVSVDALEEFKIQTSSYAPEFGRTPGGQVSLVTRSGTNRFHGSVFEYLRNEKLDANDWFSNSAGLPRARLRQNDFGGTAGGPLYLPRFGEGGPSFKSERDRAFFFFSYEGLRLRQPQTAIINVPALRVRQSAPEALRPLLAAFVLPTGPEVGATGRAPFAGNYSNPSKLDATSLRLDFIPSHKHVVFGRFNYAPSSTASRVRSSPSWARATDFGTTTFTAGLTSSFTANHGNELRANYSRTESNSNNFVDNFGGAVPFDPAAYLPASARGTRSFFAVSTYAGEVDLGVGARNVQRQLNLVDNLSLVRGAHQTRFGADYRRLTPSYQSREYLQFLLFGSPDAVLTGTVSFAQLLGIRGTRPVFDNLSLYAQDTWKATKRMTLTYGTRWELNPPPHEATGLQPFVVRGFENPATAQLAPLGTPLWETTYGNFAPRLGGAYTLSNAPGRETVVRAGFGLFYDLGSSQGADAFTGGRFATTLKTLSGVPFPLTDEQATLGPFPQDATHTQINIFNPHLKLPYTLQWNLTVERSLGAAQTASAAYVGARGRRLINRQFVSAPNPSLFSLNYLDNAASSQYDSMQLQFRRRLARGVQALASYTWSHSTDDVSDEFTNLIRLRGDSDFDVRHNFSAAATLNLPGLNRARTLSPLTRGWAVDLIAHAQSAAPVTVLTSRFVQEGARLVNVRPNVVAGVPLYLDDPNAPGGRRINPAAFIAPPAGTQGDSGRNTVRGFPLRQIDLALDRRFALGEGPYLQLRGEAFNIFNHPNFGAPVVSLSDTSFGRSTVMLGRDLAGLSPVFQIGGPRSIQLSVRLGF
jgi:hypothetical protein